MHQWTIDWFGPTVLVGGPIVKFQVNQAFFLYIEVLFGCIVLQVWTSTPDKLFSGRVAGFFLFS
jgi:hypothetical protein